MKLSPTQKQVLMALIDGQTLKSHRYLDGRKVYRLHALNGTTRPVRRSTVDCLRRYGLIDSNKKFPAATYLLTAEGKALTSQLTEIKQHPLSATHSK